MPPRKSAAASPSLWARFSPWARRLLPYALAGLGVAAGFLVPYVWHLDQRVQAEFENLQWQVPTRVLAQPLRLTPGLPMSPEALELELVNARFLDDGDGTRPGTYERDGANFSIGTRGFRDIDGAVPAARLEVRIANGRVERLTARGEQIASARLDPARIATLYGSKQEERRLVRLQDVPPLLITTLQAVEDRDFKTHMGVDFSGMLRALVFNVREGELRQGASTLTQQLVRNLFLSRERSLSRKAREILYSLIIEARFEKSRILEAYLNQIYLGQLGGQAVHGVSAGADFWFGRDLDQLQPADIALLIGMIRGPSEYDARRHPERALERRNLVLRQMHETGLIDAAELKRSTARPLGVVANASLSRNRYPAFMELVREQLARDYPAEALRGAGLTVLTTLSPSAQGYAERAVTEQIKALTQPKRPELQAGLVVTDTATGEVVAVVGARETDAHGFNRAITARRPIGSLVKPFVYLLALAQPQRYSLASLVEDAPIEVRLPGNKRWNPDNSDNISHGWVTLQQALSRSYNQATVRIGLDVGVERVSKLLDGVAKIDAPANPSLLLGAVDLSPLQVAQAYQFLASSGQMQPLRAVRAVLDAHSGTLKRYDTQLEPPFTNDSVSARITSIALQDAVRNGTGRRLIDDGLGALAPAGKTGTSNDSRDSWFAGYTGSHLAVIWMGNDANEPTGLYGATGAMRIWSALFKRLPSATLQVPVQGLESAWVDVENYAQTDEDCPDARRFVFVAGQAPEQYQGCRLERLRGWFDRQDER